MRDPCYLWIRQRQDIRKGIEVRVGAVLRFRIWKAVRWQAGPPRTRRKYPDDLGVRSPRVDAPLLHSTSHSGNNGQRFPRDAKATCPAIWLQSTSIEWLSLFRWPVSVVQDGRVLTVSLTR